MLLVYRLMLQLIPNIRTKPKYDAKGWSIIKFYGKLMEGKSIVNGQGAIQGWMPVSNWNGR
jgi:hypothetical protein